MSRVFKCDRCGAMYARQPAPVERPRYTAPKTQVPADLCPICTGDLQVWMARGGEQITLCGDCGQIVRCGECEHMMPNGYCEEFADRGICPSAADFCSHGKRKDGKP